MDAALPCAGCHRLLPANREPDCLLNVGLRVVCKWPWLDRQISDGRPLSGVWDGKAQRDQVSRVPTGDAVASRHGGPTCGPALS